eukprot:5935806-Heterocapsa_arctica.AAC.1
MGEDLQTQYWSLLGGVAWMGVVCADIAVYVQYLQLNAQAPKTQHIKELNKLVRYVKRTTCELVYKAVPGPRKLWIFADSAFKATEPDCLAIRAA